MHKNHQEAKPNLMRRMVESLPGSPWNDFLFGLVAPLTLLWTFAIQAKPAIGAAAALAWCGAVILLHLLRTRRFCLMAAICFAMVAARLAAATYVAHHPTADWLDWMAPAAANGLLALVFLVSTAGDRPLVVRFLDDETLEKIPEAIRRSPSYMTTWRHITLVWGAAYLLQALLVAAAHRMQWSWATAIDFALGWPAVLGLLALSVAYPRWYWARRSRGVMAAA
jgi:hypothetical protein